MRRAMRVGLVTGCLLGLLPGTTWAAPSGLVVAFSCDDGQSYDLNLGAPPNQSSTAFVVGTSTIFVAKHLEISVDGEVVYSWDRGIKGFEGVSLITCSGDLGGSIITVVGYLTPRTG